MADIVSRQALLIAALDEASVEVRLEQLEALRVHKSREHPIRYLGGIADARWCDRGLEGRKYIKITDATVRPFLHLLNPTRRPRQESFGFCRR